MIKIKQSEYHSDNIFAKVLVSNLHAIFLPFSLLTNW